MTLPPPPPGWNSDALTTFLDNERLNQFATYSKKPAARSLIEVDAVMRQLLSNLVDPSPHFPMQFMLRAHATFIAAAGAAMAGQLYESTVLQRAALETAAYGLFIGKDIARAKLWLSRHDSNSKADEVRRTFGAGNMKRHFGKIDPMLADTFSILYETSIDFGAHPNERGVLFNIAQRKEGTREIFDTVYLHSDGPQLDYGMKSCIQIGIWLLLSFKSLYAEIVEQHGVDHRISVLMAGH